MISSTTACRAAERGREREESAAQSSGVDVSSLGATDVEAIRKEFWRRGRTTEATKTVNKFPFYI
jgi:hypothetical protein